MNCFLTIQKTNKLLERELFENINAIQIRHYFGWSIYNANEFVFSK